MSFKGKEVGVTLLEKKEQNDFDWPLYFNPPFFSKATSDITMKAHKLFEFKETYCYFSYLALNQQR